MGEKLHWKLNNIHNTKQMCGPIKIMYYRKEQSFRNKMGILITYRVTIIPREKKSYNLTKLKNRKEKREEEGKNPNSNN